MQKVILNSCPSLPAVRQFRQAVRRVFQYLINVGSEYQSSGLLIKYLNDQLLFFFYLPASFTQNTFLDPRKIYAFLVLATDIRKFIPIISLYEV